MDEPGLLARSLPIRKSDPLPIDRDGDGALDLLVGDEATDVTFFKGLDDGTLDLLIGNCVHNDADKTVGHVYVLTRL